MARTTRNSAAKREVAEIDLTSDSGPKRRRQSPRNQIVLDSAEPEERSVMQVMMDQLKSLQEKVSSMETREGTERESSTSSTPSESAMITTPSSEQSTKETFPEPGISFTESGWLKWEGEAVDVESMTQNQVSKALMYLIVESNGSNLYGLEGTPRRGPAAKRPGLTKKQKETLQRYNFSGDSVALFSNKWDSLKSLNDFEERANMAVDSFSSKWQLSDVWDHMLHDLQVDTEYRGSWFQRRYQALQELYGSNHRRAAIVELSNLKPHQFEDLHSYLTVYAWLWIIGGQDGHAADLSETLFEYLKVDTAWQTMQRANLQQGGWVRLCSDELLDEWAEARSEALLEEGKKDYTRPRRVRPAKKTQAMKREDVQSNDSTVLRDRYHSNRCFKCGGVGHVVKECTNDGTDDEE